MSFNRHEIDIQDRLGLEQEVFLPLLDVIYDLEMRFPKFCRSLEFCDQLVLLWHLLDLKKQKEVEQSW
jgi:hypothetical protein